MSVAREIKKAGTWKAISGTILGIAAVKSLWNIIDLWTTGWTATEHLYALVGIGVVMALVYNKVLFK